MARYTGPKVRVSRRYNHPILGGDKYKKRKGPPGQHTRVSRNSGTGYAVQFSEKQKVKKVYGMQERQFVRFFKLAQNSHGNSANKLMELLERRLDNIVYRLKLAATRAQARQMVSHGHVLVNGKKFDIPSALLASGDEIRLIDKIKNSEYMKSIADKLSSQEEVKWLDYTSDGGKVKNIPGVEDFDKSLNAQLIVELYNR